jgi:hypothetical protein
VNAASRRVLSTPVARLIAVGVLALVSCAAAQEGCLSGNVALETNVKGRVELCPKYVAKVPDLQKRLDEFQKTLSGNEALLRELRRSARGVNALGRNVDANREVELLQSFSRELQDLMKADQKQMQEQTAQLADKLDNLQDMITQSKEDQKTAVQTMAALNGRLGDAVAALDLTKAEQQLESIQAELNKIEKNTEETNRILRQQAEREKEAAERQQREAEESDKDPDMYTRAQIMSLPSSPRSNIMPYMIFFSSRPPPYPPFIDSTLSVAFHKGAESWRLDATDKQVGEGGELWRINFDEVGDRATLCFVAHDKQSGRLKEWMQRYKVTPKSSEARGVNFIPDGDPTMWLTDGEPCDGVTNIRKLPSPEAGTTPPPSAAQRQMNELLAATREQVLKARSSPNAFAHIMAQGSRRDHMNENKWLIEVSTQPFKPGTTLYDVSVQANLLDASGRVTPLQLSNRQLFVNIESRYAWVDHMGTKAVVCLTAKDPARDKPYRLTQWFTIETSRVYWKDGGAQNPGDQATFVPAQPATLTEASDLPCR